MLSNTRVVVAPLRTTCIYLSTHSLTFTIDKMFIIRKKKGTQYTSHVAQPIFFVGRVNSKRVLSPAIWGECHIVLCCKHSGYTAADKNANHIYLPRIIYMHLTSPTYLVRT